MYSNEKQYWVVGYSEWGRWQIRTADVNEPATYTIVEDLGPQLLDAALEFDGDFVTFGDDTHFSLVTEERPWMCVVTTSKKLYLKRVMNDLSTAQLLSTDVTQVSMCRGFKSNTYDMDLGLVVVYLKSNGSVWLRTKKPLSNGTIGWEDEEQIVEAGTGNTRVQALRLNDYRTGIYVQGCNKLFITPRTYIGDTVRTEHVYLDGELDFQTVPFRNESVDCLETFSIQEVNFCQPNIVQVHANYPLIDFDDTWNKKRNALSLTKSSISGQEITRTYCEGGDLFIVLKKPQETVYQRFWFKIHYTNRYGYLVTPQCRPILPETSFATPDSPPVEVTEHVDLELSTSAASIHFPMVQKQELLYEFEEKCYFDLSSQSIEFPPVQIKHTSSEIKETVSMDLVTAAMTIQFPMVQTGISPI